MATNETIVKITEFTGSVIPESFLIFFFALLIIVVAYYIRNWALLILGGILFFILGFYDVFSSLNNSLEFLFFTFAGILIIYQGISFFADERKESEK